MPEKKEQNKFTIQFNAADPSHRQVADVLNRQGRRKAQRMQALLDDARRRVEFDPKAFAPVAMA